MVYRMPRKAAFNKLLTRLHSKHSRRSVSAGSMVTTLKGNDNSDCDNNKTNKGLRKTEKDIQTKRKRREEEGRRKEGGREEEGRREGGEGRRREGEGRRSKVE